MDAVAQKSQSTAHPTCDEIQTVIRFPSFISTDSTFSPVCNSNRNFRVNSPVEPLTCINLRGCIRYFSSRLLRKPVGIFPMSSNESTWLR